MDGTGWRKKLMAPPEPYPYFSLYTIPTPGVNVSPSGRLSSQAVARGRGGFYSGTLRVF
jgi:hypothetical protein